MSNEYTKDSIESLSPLEHVRLRPGVYAGDTSNSNQLILEVFANSLDEHNIGHGDRINVTITDDNVCSIEDYGQGFPIGEFREDGKTVLEAAFSVMNTSGKFRDDGVYEGSSLGLNGMGSKIATFLSHWLEVESFKNNQSEHLWFKEGVLEKREIESYDYMDRDCTGTVVTFQPSEEFFTSAKPNQTQLKQFFNDIACLCPDLTIYFNDELIQHTNGLTDLINNKIGKDIEIIDRRFSINESNFQLEMSFTSKTAASVTSYVNYGLTESGPHITQIKSTITRLFNNWAKENGILKKGDSNLDGSSIQEGMVLVFNCVSTGVAYDAQIKSRIVKMDTSFIADTFAPQLELWMDNNPDCITAIIEKAITAKKAADAAKKARAAVKKKAAEAKEEKVFKLPTTLTDAWDKDRSQCELLVCEGKSAASGLVAARDSRTQAVYGVRGKMLSVLKTTPEKILANQEINNLVQALGLDCNLKTAKLTYDEGKLRYGKIVACADADPDGQQIENLLFNILWYMCPELIIAGHVYSAVPPLFRITTKNNEYIYLKDEKELKEYGEQHKSEKYLVNRNKGLGEQDSDELSECLLNPESRNIVQLTVEDIDKTDKLFDNLYGKKVEPRVKFILEHSEEADIE